MKATLEFNLPEDRPEHDLALMGGQMHSALLEIQEILRQATKYGFVDHKAVQDYPDPESVVEALAEKIRCEIRDVLDRMDIP